MVWCLILIWENSQSLLTQTASPFFSFWYSHYRHTMSSVAVLVFGYCYFFLLFSSLLLFLEYSIVIFLSSEILSSAISSPVMGLSKVFFISVTVFLIFNFNFLRIYASAYIIHLFLYIAYFFHYNLKPINKVFNSWFDNSNIHSIPNSGSDDC